MPTIDSITQHVQNQLQIGSPETVPYVDVPKIVKRRYHHLCEENIAPKGAPSETKMAPYAFNGAIESLGPIKVGVDNERKFTVATAMAGEKFVFGCSKRNTRNGVTKREVLVNSATAETLTVEEQRVKADPYNPTIGVTLAIGRLLDSALGL